ncbi:hypothetical protein WS82_31965, partial [Burkholderia sp. MSMB2041]
QVLKENGRNAQDKSYMWVYRSAEDSEQPVVLFEYQPGRGQQYASVLTHISRRRSPLPSLPAVSRLAR